MEKKTIETKLKTLIRDISALAFIKQLLQDHPDAGVFFVGGMVRDVALNRDTTDYDLVIRGMSLDTLRDWLEANGRVDVVGRRFGVIKFIPNDVEHPIEPIDIALPRFEQPTPDSRGGYREFELQVDAEMDIEKDLKRRDFTMNAVAFNVGEHALVDPFGGLNDIENRRVKAVGDPRERFAEDLSRMLRAVRFATELNFTIEAETHAAIKQLAKHINDTFPGGDFVVPREVIGLELAKMLTANPKRALKCLHKTGLAAQLAPTLTKRLMQNFNILQNTDANASLTAVAALFLALLPADQRNRFLKNTGLDTLPQDGPVSIDKKAAKWIAAQIDKGYENPIKSDAADFEDRWMNARGDVYKDVLTTLGKTRVVQAANKREKEIRDRLDVAKDEKIPPLIDGGDVLECIEPGPRVGEVLKRVRSAQLEGEIKTKKEALEKIRQIKNSLAT